MRITSQAWAACGFTMANLVFVPEDPCQTQSLASQREPTKMEWSAQKDVILCREVMYAEPFQYKERTALHVQAWQDLVKKILRNYPNHQFAKLTFRGAKEHLGLLLKNFKKKTAAEMRASGISPRVTELDELLEQIHEKMIMYVAENEKEKEKKKKEEAAAKDVRLKAMETLSATKKRREQENGEDEGKKKPKKSRSNGSDTVNYLKEKAEEESNHRAKAEEAEVRCHEGLMRMMAAQQAQQQQFQQHQTQLHRESMLQQQQECLQMQQMMANQQQQNFKILMAMLGKKEK